MRALPSFSLIDYRTLLEDMLRAGFALRPVSEMKRAQGAPVVFVRHDIDFSLKLVLPLARIEAELGVEATYYLLVDGPYSMKEPANRQALQELSDLGHEIGLHYDLSFYPADPEGQRSRLKREVQLVESWLSSSVKTISMHEPHRNAGDPFQQEEWVHPHDPRLQGGLMYVSDSCRAWRDESLSSLFEEDGPDRLLFLTHPELWLNGAIEDRFTYLEQEVIPQIPAANLPYFREDVPRIWERHVGVWCHDYREKMEALSLALIPMKREWVEEEMSEFLRLFRDSQVFDWKEPEILLEVPGKWTESVALVREGEILGFSFNSIRGEFLYIHAFVVGSQHRFQGHGEAIMRGIQIRSRLSGSRGIHLRVADANTGAEAFYERMGFELYEPEPEAHQSVWKWSLS